MGLEWVWKTHERSEERMTLAEYLEKVVRGEIPHRGAHRYLLDALEDEVGEGGLPFTGKIVGAERQLREFMSILRAGALGQDVRRRIILLVGPPGSAKSTFVYLLKRAFERYSRTPKGAIYRIAGCPINEDPLRGVPDEARPALETQYGIRIEQHLCPVCAHRLESEWGGDPSKIPVERFYITDGVGIGVFAAGEPNTQDASHLIGAVSLSGLRLYGSESHPLAWSWDGALLRGNRGIVELVEMLKAKPELLHYLLTTAQERQVPVDRVGFVDVDLVLIAHTNYSEYNRFWKEPKNEAIKDRTRVVEWPYVLRIRDEEKVYDIMLGNPPGHLAPWTKTLAAGVAVLSRLQKRPSDSRFPPMASLKLYNNVWGPNGYPTNTDDPLSVMATREEFEEGLVKAYPEDGKKGLSPRVVVDWISSALVEEGKCLNPIALAHKIRTSYTEGLTEWGKGDIEGFIGMMLNEYHNYLDKLIQRAFTASFEAEAEHYWRKYLEHASAAVQGRKIQDPVTGRWVDPDTKFLRRLEGAIGIAQPAADGFRKEVLAHVGTISVSGGSVRWDSDSRLAKAIEKIIMADRMNVIRTTVSAVVPDEEQASRLEEVKRFLIEGEGYCEECASFVLRYYADRAYTGATS